jgi:hypothetical protein
MLADGGRNSKLALATRLNAVLHRDPRQFGPQTTDLHLLGRHLLLARNTLQPSGTVQLDPVAQGLLNHSQTAGCRRHRLARLRQPDCLVLEFQV